MLSLFVAAALLLLGRCYASAFSLVVVVPSSTQPLSFHRLYGARSNCNRHDNQRISRRRTCLQNHGHDDIQSVDTSLLSSSSSCQPPYYNQSNDAVIAGIHRRDMTKHLASTLLAALTIPPSVAHAAINNNNNDLFRPNPLTNPILEQLRIWNQDEVDNIKYDGELTSGSAGRLDGGLEQYKQLLQPILLVEYNLVTIDSLLQKHNEQSSNNGRKKDQQENYTTLLTAINNILSTPILADKIIFKKSFNAFADNIYYSDPDRANLYLGGGAIPKTTQSVAYLLRNEILTNLEDMKAEVQYLTKEVGKISSNDEIAAMKDEDQLDMDELFRLSNAANDGMKKYLDLVPPRELEAARADFAKDS